MFRLVAALVLTFAAILAGLIAVDSRVATRDAPYQVAGCINGNCS